MQFSAMELKIGVNSVENGFGISLSVTIAGVCLWSAGLKFVAVGCENLGSSLLFILQQQR